MGQGSYIANDFSSKRIMYLRLLIQYNLFQVDVDQRTSLTAGGQENLSAAALLSAAKAGSGYSAFA